MNKGYIDWLRLAILETHGCKSKYVETVPVHEQFHGETVWQGDVEVFELVGHPQTNICYAWGTSEFDDGKDLKAVTVLKLRPVESPQTAVQAFIVGKYKNVI